MTELLTFKPRIISNQLIKVFGLQRIAKKLNVDIESKTNVVISVVAIFSGFLMSKYSLIKIEATSNFVINLVVEFFIVFTIILSTIFVFKFINVSENQIKICSTDKKDNSETI